MENNIFYFKKICAIGGIETFFYELAKKYCELDITIYYMEADYEQLKRLKKYVRCKKYNGEHIKCKKAFFNFNTEIINNVEAEEYHLIAHGDYKMLSSPPPKHAKINKYLGVSKTVCESYTELTGTSCELTYNPISKDDIKPVIHLVCASRLKDKVKGSNRIQKLVEALDNYCNKKGNKYQLTIFTDDYGAIDNQNVCYMKKRIDIRDYIADADYTVQLSDDFEGYNYTVNESLMYGTPVIITPCKVYEELGIDDTMSIRLDFDLKNIDEVIEQIFTKKMKVNYTPPNDNWDNLLVKGKSKYKEELEMKYEVEALDTYEKNNIKDAVLGRVIKTGERFIVDKERLDVLLGENSLGLIFVKEIEKKVETAVKKETKEKAISKTKKK